MDASSKNLSCVSLENFRLCVQSSISCPNLCFDVTSKSDLGSLKIYFSAMRFFTFCQFTDPIWQVTDIFGTLNSATHASVVL